MLKVYNLMQSFRKKGMDELVSNFIWIILTLIFLALIVLFVDSKSDNPARLEEKYAKQIALLLDNAKPGMEITLDMFDAYSLAIKLSGKSKNEIHESLVTIQDNFVNVKVKPDGKGVSYHFFNNIQLKLINGHPIPDFTDGRYTFIVENYK